MKHTGVTNFTIVGSGEPKDKARFKVAYPQEEPPPTPIVSKET